MRLLFFALILATAGVATAAPDSKSTTKPSSGKEEPKWQDILDKTGEIAKVYTAKVNVSPRTPKWRLALATSKADEQPKGNADLTSAKITVLIEVRTAGHTAFQALPTKPWKGRAGDGIQLDFDNGLWPDGSARQFQIAVSGSYIKYELQVQDQGEGSLVKNKEKPKQ